MHPHLGCNKNPSGQQALSSGLRRAIGALSSIWKPAAERSPRNGGIIPCWFQIVRARLTEKMRNGARTRPQKDRNPHTGPKGVRLSLSSTSNPLACQHAFWSIRRGRRRQIAPSFCSVLAPPVLCLKVKQGPLCSGAKNHGCLAGDNQIGLPCGTSHGTLLRRYLWTSGLGGRRQQELLRPPCQTKYPVSLLSKHSSGVLS